MTDCSIFRLCESLPQLDEVPFFALNSMNVQDLCALCVNLLIEGTTYDLRASEVLWNKEGTYRGFNADLFKTV